MIFGGAKRDRTADLLHAMQALSQLSYGPIPDHVLSRNNWSERGQKCQKNPPVTLNSED